MILNFFTFRLYRVVIGELLIHSEKLLVFRNKTNMDHSGVDEFEACNQSTTNKEQTLDELVEVQFF